jgi:hypothetical protein
MSDINKSDIKLMQSQRLDDTDQGGGQMTSQEVVDGQVNNLFPDISRLDRVYGRVSMRKAYLAVQTSARETYYGSHTILTEQASDPNVYVCFFSSEDWFDTRTDARDRIEAYLVKGPNAKMSLWGTHYRGTSALSFFTHIDWPIPEIGDVLVIKDLNNEQYVRIIDASSEAREFYDSTNYFRKVVSIKIGSQLEHDFVGVEANATWSFTTDPTQIYTTVAADASKYYGVSTLKENVVAGSLQIRVDNIQTSLVPSAASETAIIDAGAGTSISPLIQTNPNEEITVTRSILFNIASNSKLYIGEGIIPGTFTWVGGVTLTDDEKGNIYSGSTIVGSITYETGIITFGNPGVTTSGTGTVTYRPACTLRQFSDSGAIKVETNNRGFVYTYNCYPIPQSGTVKIEYLAGGKWYTLWDQGNGQLLGSDETIGSGFFNINTGSLSVTFGVMPDVGSKILIFWVKPSEYYDLSGETLFLNYEFTTNNPAVARNTFSVEWGYTDGHNTVGAFDDGNSGLIRKVWNTETVSWDTTGEDMGSIKYATGFINLKPIGANLPTASENFTIKYSYGAPEEHTFIAPPRNPGDGTITLDIVNTPILPHTLKIEWHTLAEVYEPETVILTITRIDPVYTFYDDGDGNIADGTIDYDTGIINFMPDRTTSMPVANYEWIPSDWTSSTVEMTYTFTNIQYFPQASIFPADGNVVVSYCTTDGANADEYTGTLTPIYKIKEDKVSMEIIPGGLSVLSSGPQYLIDGGDGKLYTHVDGVSNGNVHVGNINYVNKTFQIISDSIDLRYMTILFCSGSGMVEPMQTIVFRVPGAPIRPGSFFIRATANDGTVLEGTSNFSGDITGSSINGHIDFNTGICDVTFGKFIPDTEQVKLQDWYNPELSDGVNVWFPYVVRATTILFNCVITSYLPLDPDLLGLDPVRLPLDGKVPIFRDGYIIVVHNSLEEFMPFPLDTGLVLPADKTESVGRTGVDLIEAYAYPTNTQISEGTQTVPMIIQEIGNYTYDLDAGTITFLSGFSYPTDNEGTQNQIVVLSRIEDMCLASDVQVTGHIAITSPLVHDYPMNDTLVSSVLPSADLQSRAYNEFEQSSWSGVWSNNRIGAEPLASYNFVDYPITVINRPSIMERWLILFSTSTTISIIGENFGVLAQNVSIVNGNAIIGGNNCVAVENRQFPGEYYFIIRCDGFGAGWASGNCIRFNQDAANFPLWFVRTTLQAPPTEPIDHYTIQIRGDSS